MMVGAPVAVYAGKNVNRFWSPIVLPVVTRDNEWSNTVVVVVSEFGRIFPEFYCSLSRR